MLVSEKYCFFLNLLKFLVIDFLFIEREVKFFYWGKILRIIIDNNSLEF